VDCYRSSLSNTFLKQINMDNMSNPNDMVVCCTTQDLYIADDTVIWKVHLQDESVTEFVKHGVEKGKPITLSINSQSDSLLLCDSSEEMKCYGLDAARQLSVVKQQVLATCSHTLQMANGSMIVCGKTPDDENYTVVEIDKDGNELNTFYSLTSDIKGPIYAVLIPTINEILIADQGHNCIMLLRPDLQLDEVLLQQRHGIDGVSRMYFDETTGHLYVGMKNGQVSCYRIKDDVVIVDRRATRLRRFLAVLLLKRYSSRTDTEAVGEDTSLTSTADEMPDSTDNSQ